MSTPLTINPIGVDRNQPQGFQFEIEVTDYRKTYTLNTRKPANQLVRIDSSFSYYTIYGLDTDFNNFTPDIDMVVDWGDGTRSSIKGLFDESKNSHTYTDSGRYKITIEGKCNCLDFTNDESIIKLISFGKIKFGYLKFFGASTLREILGNFTVENIESNLFSFDAMFANCYSLTTVVPMLFSNITESSMKDIFRNCVSMVYTPSKLFYNCKIMSLHNVFENCIKIESITPDTLDGIVDLMVIDYLFMGCEKITHIPENLIKTNTKLKKLYATFAGTGITLIPVNLFENNLELVSMQYVFMNTPITSIPANLLMNNKKLTDVTGLFYGSDILSIPTDLFAYNTKIEKFDYTFARTKISTIPTELFSRCTLATSFICTFYYSDLKSVNTDIFYNNNLAEDFTSTFSMCAKLEYVTSNLFSGAKGTKFLLTFWNCKYLVKDYPKLWDMFRLPKYYGGGIPSQYMYQTYAGCISLINRDSIPDNFK